jgi:CDGSH-type Zn-finger protein
MIIMEEPKIAAKIPDVSYLKKGEYYWCACGKSSKQPFCDGTHKGSNFTPVRFEITEDKTVALCMCKHSSNKPFCDGTHHTV